MFFSWDKDDPLFTNQNILVFSVPKTTPRNVYRIFAKKTDSGIHFSICLQCIID